MKKTLLSLLGLLCFMIMQAQVAKTVTMTQAGTLTDALTEDEKNTITDLTLTGPIDARDFYVMRSQMPALAVLDIEDTNIEEYSGYGGTNNTVVSNYHPKDGIPPYAFYNPNGITNTILYKIILPTSLKTIEQNAFNKCSALTSVRFPSGLTDIRSWAFYNCGKLSGELKLPSGLTSLGDHTFSGCSKLSVIRCLAQTPPSCYSTTFYKTNIRSVYVPKNSFAAYKEHDYWKRYALILKEENEFTLHVTTPGAIGATLVDAGGRPNSVTSLILTGELNSDDFLQIRENMPLLHSINMEGLSNKSIPVAALRDKTTLLNIVFPSVLTSIDLLAFSGCSGLTGELILPAALTSIGEHAFSDCSGLTGELKLPVGLTSIDSYAFYKCSGLTGELKLPVGLTSIESGVFSGCVGLTRIEFSSSLTSIGESAFVDCRGLTGELILPSGLTSIGIGAFQYCSGLTGELKLPSGLTSIGGSAFMNCSGLTSIHIKKNIKNIYNNAFSGCSNVSKIMSEAVTPPSLDADVFKDINTETCALYVPQGSQINYILAPQWGVFANIIEMDIPVESYLTSFHITPGGTVQCNGSKVSNGSKIEIKAGESMKLTFAPQGGYALDQVLYDGEDVTAQVQNNQWTSPAVSKAVTVSVSFKTVQYEVAILTVGSGAIAAHIVEYNSTHTYRLAATEGYLIENVTLNGTDVTPDLENGKLTLHNIAEDQTLVITSKRDGESSEIGVSSEKTIRTWKANGQLFVESTEEMSAAEVVDMSGRTACSISKTAYAYVLNLSANGVYVVRIRTVNGEVKTVKVAM